MKTDRGFGLIEVLVSLAVLGVITIAFFASLAAAAKMTAFNEQREKARNLASSQMEYVMDLKYNSTSQNSSNNTYVPFRPLPSYYAGYSVNITTYLLSDNVNAANNSMQLIQVDVWQSSKRIVSLQSQKIRR